MTTILYIMESRVYVLADFPTGMDDIWVVQMELHNISGLMSTAATKADPTFGTWSLENPLWGNREV